MATKAVVVMSIALRSRGKREMVSTAEEGIMGLPSIEEGRSIGCVLLVEKGCYGVRL